jgi:thymidylate synthase
MEELYKVMDDLLDVEFQMKSGIDLLKELEEFYMLEKETEESEARKVAVLMKGYLQFMKSNLREIIRYIDDTTLEKSNNDKKEKQESSNAVSEEVQEFVNLTIGEHMGKAYSEWKLKQDKEPVSEIEKKYQGLLETLSPEQEEVITEYCNAIFSSGADTEEFFYRLGLKDGLNLKSTVKSTLEMLSENIHGGEPKDEE